MAFAWSAGFFPQQPSQALCSDETVPAPASSAETKDAPVEIDGRPIFLVQTLSTSSGRKSVLGKFNRESSTLPRNDIRKKMKREALRISPSILLD